MPFRPSFDCLWCGRAWEVRSDGDLEGWAGLCPDCLGNADDNGFLRMRLRAALRERGRAASDAASASPASGKTPGDWEDWYLRRGAYSKGPVHDGPWSMELDQATRWLDARPLSGVLVELGAGMGWWTTLLAEKGEVWSYDDDEASLEAARKRLVAHGLMAHLHIRDPLAPPDRAVDAVFAAYLLGGAESEVQLDERIATVRAWLEPGGSFVFVDTKSDERAPLAGPSGSLWPREPAVLRDRLFAAGFTAVDIGGTQRAFVLGRAEAPA